MYGDLPVELEKEVLELLEYPERIPAELPDLLDKYRQPFLATDRNVMNLPGIGKSMTYQTVGMTKEGKRILRFSLDAGRRHSPQVDHEGRFISWKASRSRLIYANCKRWVNVWRITVRCGIMLKGARNPVLPFLNIRNRELKSRGISRIWKLIRDQASPLVSSNPSVPDAFCPFALTAKPYTTS